MGADQTDRKKKNADAQAAFRARRANYIATLEETVTNLEAVVIQLQESCRASRTDADKLRAQVTRLHKEVRDREKFWRALWQKKKTGMPPDPTDDEALPSYAQIHSPPTSVPGRLASPTHYDPNLCFPGEVSSLISGYNGGPPPECPQRSPALDYPNVNGNGSVITRPPSVTSTGYAPYPSYTPEGSSTPDKSWQRPGLQGETDYPAIDGSQSSDSPCPNQHGGVVDDAKMADGTPYIYPDSSSISPASTPTSISSTSPAPAPYSLNFPETSVVSDFHRSIGARELTLHGGTADIPVAGLLGNNLRYRLAAATNANTVPNPSLVPAPYPRVDNMSDDRGSDSVSHQDGRTHRSTASSSRTSRSPPPNSSHNTLSIIKAQSFGRPRQSRKQTPRSSGGAAKATVDALSAWRFGINPVTNANPNKRPRRDHDEDIQP